MSITLFKYCTGNIDELDEQNYIIKGKQIKIKQDKNKGIGWTFWTCSFIVSNYLESHSKDWKNTVALELGTGCGLVSMSLSLLDCKKIYATDLEGIIENTKINISNNFNQKESEKILVDSLEWGNNNDYLKIKEKVDLIICSECLYLEAPWDKLLETILYFSHPQIEIIFAYKKRYLMQELFIEKLNSHFNCNYVNRDKFYYEFQNDLAYEIIIARSK